MSYRSEEAAAATKNILFVAFRIGLEITKKTFGFEQKTFGSEQILADTMANMAKVLEGKSCGSMVVHDVAFGVRNVSSASETVMKRHCCKYIENLAMAVACADLNWDGDLSWWNRSFKQQDGFNKLSGVERLEKAGNAAIRLLLVDAADVLKRSPETKSLHYWLNIVAIDAEAIVRDLAETNNLLASLA